MSMEADVPPPEYPTANRSAKDEVPPDYSSGSKYVVGGKTLPEPFVRLAHVRGHLSLLGAIATLRVTIEAGQDSRIPKDVIALFPTQRWAWFAGLAVERFSRWVATTRIAPLQQWINTEMPPLDVLMVWQAYLLNPIFYAEDCVRIPMLAVLKELGSRLVAAMAQIEDISSFVPSEELQSRWYDRTGTMYDPLEAIATLTHHRVECPRCGGSIDWRYINEESTGYLQYGSSVQCAACDLTITKETLGLAKFAKDLVLDPHDPVDVATYGSGVYIAGTFYTQLRGPDKQRAERTKLALRIAHPIARPANAQSMTKAEWIQHILAVTEYSLYTVKAASLSALATKNYNVQRVLSAYADDRPFSVDLVGSVVRLSTFAETMRKLRWTDKEYFAENAEDELILTHAISRYHAFFDLISSAPKNYFVPTVDIDLIWHTHQMMGQNYIANCAKYLEYIYDHHDVVEQNFLAFGFDSTWRAWRERFDLPYTYCGCPVPGDKVGDRFGRLKQLVSRKSDLTGELVPLHRADARLATHASDHNAYYIGPAADALRQARIEKVDKRQKRTTKKGDTLQVPAHDPPFLNPLSIYHGPESGSIVRGGVLNLYTWVAGAGGGNDGYIPGLAKMDVWQAMMYTGAFNTVAM